MGSEMCIRDRSRRDTHIQRTVWTLLWPPILLRNEFTNAWAAMLMCCTCVGSHAHDCSNKINHEQPNHKQHIRYDSSLVHSAHQSQSIRNLCVMITHMCRITLDTGAGICANKPCNRSTGAHTMRRGRNIRKQWKTTKDETKHRTKLFTNESNQHIAMYTLDNIREVEAFGSVNLNAINTYGKRQHQQH